MPWSQTGRRESIPLVSPPNDLKKLERDSVPRDTLLMPASGDEKTMTSRRAQRSLRQILLQAAHQTDYHGKRGWRTHRSGDQKQKGSRLSHKPRQEGKGIGTPMY